MGPELEEQPAGGSRVPGGIVVVGCHLVGYVVFGHVGLGHLVTREKAVCTGLGERLVLSAHGG